MDPYEAVDLSDAMYRVLADADLRADMRERGLKWVRGFTWRRTAEQMSRLLDDVRRHRPGEPEGSRVDVTRSAPGTAHDTRVI